jgi:hydroxyethylthiazole kinase-like uncharacterized protein yjeF
MSKRIPIITRKQVISFIKPRPMDSHKGLFGTAVIIGGSTGMVGAALLAGRAALKLGAGCVHVGLLADNAPTVDQVQPELMLHKAENALRILHPEVIAIGCGLGTSIIAQKILLDALRQNTPLVLDADALNLVARHADLQQDLCSRSVDTVLTPHPAEAARLLNTTTAEVQAGRTDAALCLAKNFNCSVVLKGANSLCVNNTGHIFLNKTGNPGMSAPGMGDVLTGMVAAFIAQGLTGEQALLLAVHLHGTAGDSLAQQGVAVGMTASELTEWARWLINQWHSQST